MRMRGMDWNTLKRNYSLIPLFIIVSMGMCGSIIYSARVALKSPEISYNKRGNPEPWNEYKNKQYKLYSPDGAEANPKAYMPDY